MNALVQRAARGAGSLFRDAWTFRRQTGRSLIFWALLALLNFAVQIVFRRNLAPGEFGMLNSLIGVVGLFLVPVVALRHAFAHFKPAAASQTTLDVARLPMREIGAVIWAFCAPLLIFPVFGLLGFPRESLGFFTLPAVLLALGAMVAGAICEERKRRFFWATLVLAAALGRLVSGAVLTASEPWAETGLAVGWIASFILLAPLWREARLDLRWADAMSAWRERDFARHALATLSIWLGLFLFTNGDRIVAQAWFGRPQENNLGYVPWGVFDSYQTAGLLGRAVIWGTQPLLLLLLVRRSGAPRTAPAVRNLFWVYVGALVAGVLLLTWLARPLARLFVGTDDPTTVYFISGFAALAIPLGLLQGFGIFALASRRYPECFTLGGASLGYVTLLYLVGRPQLMLSYAFGGCVVALMMVLLVGIVRWGRRQP